MDAELTNVNVTAATLAEKQAETELMRAHAELMRAQARLTIAQAVAAEKENRDARG
jgi:hypothetical protein